jgi:hypothetical protein
MSRWLLLVPLLTLLPAQAGAETRLLMLDQPACEWCAQWDSEVGAVYARTAEGKQAPLMRSRIFDPLPEGVALARQARFTPTFVLIEDGREVGRIEGYPGEDFFYGMLQQLLERAGKPES